MNAGERARLRNETAALQVRNMLRGDGTTLGRLRQWSRLRDFVFQTTDPVQLGAALRELDVLLGRLLREQCEGDR